MTTLITGGGSQIGAGREAVFASRSGKRIPEGFKSPFETGPFEAVYLLGPPNVMDTSKSMVPFIDLAVEKGVKRFVYLSATVADEDDDESEPGRLPMNLKERGLDRVILRPTWFIGTREKGEVVTTIPTARVPFVATEDNNIAQAAFEGIVNKDNQVEWPILLGPDTITFDKFASITISAEEMVQFYLRFMTEEVARWYVESELGIEKGSEDKWTTLLEEDQKKLKVKVVVGKTSVRDWVLKHKKELLEATM
ncbi:NmrA family protein [Coprinopsis sp. MPI-PUGE-AT-0042]|nr:NmrA family protein [Coprinopsis sp. MPI-PUGE-AT-0042]